MNFSNDRDLLLLEPNVFVDVPLLAQQRIHVTDGQISGITLTSALANFTTAQVGPGCVVLIAGQPHEVISRVDAHTLTVSLPRTSLAESPIPSTVQGSGLTVTARTFAPQASLVHDLLLGLLGIEPGEASVGLNEDAIVSLGQMSRLESLGTLERVYSAAAAIVGDNDALYRRAREYRDRFRNAVAASRILLDTDGDGRGDVTRDLGVIQLRRI